MRSLHLDAELGPLVVEDDGKGLDPEAIRRKALQQGIKPSLELAALSALACCGGPR